MFSGELLAADVPVLRLLVDDARGVIDWITVIGAPLAPTNSTFAPPDTLPTIASEPEPPLASALIRLFCSVVTLRVLTI